MSVINNVRRIASQKGIRLSHLCSLIGYGRSYFIDLEKTGRDIPSEKIPLLADALGVSVDYLLGRSPDIKEAPAGNPEGAETEDPSSDELRRRISEALSRLDPSYLEIVAAQIDALQALQESREEKGSLHD